MDDPQFKCSNCADLPNSNRGTAMNLYHGSSQGSSMDIDEIVSGTSMLSIQGDLSNVERSCQSEADDDDGLEQIWREMALALELSKDVKENALEDSEGKGECVHSVILREDLGFVCQLCGFIETRIENVMGREWDMNELMSGGSSRQSKRDKGLKEGWREMALEIEFSKDVNEYIVEDNEEKGICEHSVIMRDDMGFICQICGTIERRTENIVGYEWVKGLDGFYMVKQQIATEIENDIGDESVYLAARLQALSTSNA